MESSVKLQDSDAGGVVPKIRTSPLKAAYCPPCLRCLAAALMVLGCAVNAGTLTHSFAIVPTGTDVNLSLDGAMDWIHWGTFTEYAPDRKTGLQPLISDFTPVGN